MSNNSNGPVLSNILKSDSSRNLRLKLINRIEEELGGRVISYLENPNHPLSFIQSDDIIPFEDALRTIGDTKKGFLILNSSGGDGNTAEKLLFMCRERFTEGFTIIVPNFAKSAATMMCLGADKIMMGYLAELGPIDPQIQINDEIIPARSFIDGLELVREKVKNGDPPSLYTAMLQKVRPEIISTCTSAIDEAECFAKNWLTKYMLKDDHDQAEKVAKWLSDGQIYKSHGKVIDWREAKNVLKLNAECIRSESTLWNLVWKLYVQSVQDMKKRSSNTAKIIEGSDISLINTISLETK